MDNTDITNNQQEVNNQQNNNPTDNITITNNVGSMTATVDNNAGSVDSIDIDKIEAQQGAQQQEDVADDNSPAQVQTAIDNQLQAETDLKADLASKGVDFNTLAKEFEDNGELSQDSLSKLERAGYPKSVVDAYINGMQSVADKFVSNVMNMAGGEEGYKQLVNYLQGQPQNVVNSFNALIERGNLDQINLAINGLLSQMQRAYGTSNPSIMARPTGGTVAGGYQSQAEMVKDMSDARYGKDKAFTEAVYAKIAKSNFF